MSLEDLLTRNNELLGRNNELLEALIDAAADKAGGEPAGEKPKTPRTRKPKDEAKTEGKEEAKTEAGALTHDAVKGTVGEWLGEFKGAVLFDGETEARKGAIKAALAKLVGKEGATIADVPAADLHRVITWLDKQKAKDHGHGVGRITAPPAAADEPESSDDDDI